MGEWKHANLWGLLAASLACSQVLGQCETLFWEQSVKYPKETEFVLCLLHTYVAACIPTRMCMDTCTHACAYVHSHTYTHTMSCPVHLYNYHVNLKWNKEEREEALGRGKRFTLPFKLVLSSVIYNFAKYFLPIIMRSSHNCDVFGET